MQDQYGNPILPGYRKPFNSETARAAAAKSVNARVTTKRALQILKAIDELLKARKRGSNKTLHKSISPTTSPISPTPLDQNVSPLLNDAGLVEKQNVSLKSGNSVGISPTISPQPLDQNASEVKADAKNLTPTPESGVKPVIEPVSIAIPQTGP